MKYFTLLWFVLLSSSVYGAPIPSTAGMDAMALKQIIQTPPDEIEPEMAVLVGTIYQNGMSEIGIKPNIDRAKVYYKSAGDRGVAMGYLTLSGLQADEGNYEGYVDSLGKVMRANDKELSAISGLKLSGFYVSENRQDLAIETLRYVADHYRDARAQFMLGWSILSGGYVPDDLTKKDGNFYLFQACSDPQGFTQIIEQCKSIFPQ